MAEGLLCHLSNSSVEVHSAGTKPVGVNPLAIAVMCEIGVDISAHRAKSEAEFSKQSFDTVITVCDSVAEQCPVFPGSPRLTPAHSLEPPGPRRRYWLA
jgi:arsenate reductase (thioredoxin)